MLRHAHFGNKGGKRAFAARPMNVRSGERRWFVLEASSEFADNKPYFEVLWCHLNSGGLEALFHFLLERDLSGFSQYLGPPMSAAKLSRK